MADKCRSGEGELGDPQPAPVDRDHRGRDLRAVREVEGEPVADPGMGRLRQERVHGHPARPQGVQAPLADVQVLHGHQVTAAA